MLAMWPGNIFQGMDFYGRQQEVPMLTMWPGNMFPGHVLLRKAADNFLDLLYVLEIYSRYIGFYGR